MQRSSDRFVEVELVEDDADDEVTDPGRAQDEGRAPRWTMPHLPREFWATVVVALAVGASGVAVGRLGVERMRSAELAGVDGLSASLAEPLREAWRAPGTGLVTTTDDVVVHWSADTGGVVATDLDDGATRYSVPGSCRLVPTDGDGAPPFVSVRLAYRAGPQDALLCLDDDGAGGGPFDARETTARVVDLATGETRQTFAMLAGGSWIVVAGDVVSVGLDHDGRAVAGRWSLTTGERRWAYQGTEVAPRPSDGSGFTTSERTIGLEVGGLSVTLDLETGAETEPDVLDDDDIEAMSQRVDLPDGRSLEYHLALSGGVRTTVHPPGGGEPVTVDGFVLAPSVDDGSVPDAVTVQDFDTRGGTPELSLVDLATGEPRWTVTDVHGTGGVLSGVVLMAGPERITAFDAGTGELRWESPVDDLSFTGSDLVTDGRRVLVLERKGADVELVARDVRTGEREWASQVPTPGAALVPLPDGTVLAVGSSELVALRP
ncbi:outer membrane protein assembly factor BamB family protein [Cellulomonas aerilata]|uniref:Pyrrolo-quinoline quinone repeat domain-containing protein n=1 Tax=Cellulomonas aerilata TaxID=515326 RepID=A0A512DAX9_9CELL|nr:PQQ-binding-like beta-propeller repeat protein [Cellulomonas aerilata]GEO33624.1 hypothetical protein CAE01nite_13490 [Cellulomonas aerilata]